MSFAKYQGGTNPLRTYYALLMREYVKKAVKLLFPLSVAPHSVPNALHSAENTASTNINTVEGLSPFLMVKNGGARRHIVLRCGLAKKA